MFQKLISAGLIGSAMLFGTANAPEPAYRAPSEPAFRFVKKNFRGARRTQVPGIGLSGEVAGIRDDASRSPWAREQACATDSVRREPCGVCSGRGFYRLRALVRVVSRGVDGAGWKSGGWNESLGEEPTGPQRGGSDCEAASGRGGRGSPLEGQSGRWELLWWP